MYGGLEKGNNVLGDMWILGVDTVKWTEVSLVLYYELLVYGQSGVTFTSK